MAAPTAEGKLAEAAPAAEWKPAEEASPAAEEAEAARLAAEEAEAARLAAEQAEAERLAAERCRFFETNASTLVPNAFLKSTVGIWLRSGAGDSENLS